MNKQTTERYNKLIDLGIREKDINKIKDSKLNNFRKAWYVKRLLRLDKIENTVPYIAEILIELKEEVKQVKELETHDPTMGLILHPTTKTINKKIENLLVSQHYGFETSGNKSAKLTLIGELRILEKRATNRIKNKLARRAKRMNRNK